MLCVRGGGAKGEEKEGRSGEEEELSSELCNLQRPFLPTFLLTTPMQAQCSNLTFHSLSKCLSYPNTQTLHAPFLQIQPHSLSQPGL